MKFSNSVFLLTIVFLCCFEAGSYVLGWRGWQGARERPLAWRGADKFNWLLSSSDSDSDSSAILTGSSLFLYPAFLCDQERSGKPKILNTKLRAASIASYSRADCFEAALSAALNEKTKVVNLAAGGALMSDQYLVLKNWLLHGKRPKYAICDLSPREFQDNFQSRIDRTAVSLNLPEGFSFAESIGASLAGEDLLTSIKFESKIFNERAAYKQRILVCVAAFAHRPASLSDSAVTMSAVVGNDSAAPGVSKATILEGNGPCHLGGNQSLADYYRKAYRPVDAVMYKKEIYFLKAYVELARKNGIEVFLVMMPLPKENLAELPLKLKKQFEEDVSQIAQRSGISLVLPASQSAYLDDDFEDFAHLNARGGHKLFVAIADAVAARQSKSRY